MTGTECAEEQWNVDFHKLYWYKIIILTPTIVVVAQFKKIVNMRMLIQN